MRTQSLRRSGFFRLLIPLLTLASWPGIAATQDDFSGPPKEFDDAANRAEVAAALDSLANHARPCAFEWSSWAASRQQARLARVADCLVDAVVPWRQR
jgi:hypothetical protein